MEHRSRYVLYFLVIQFLCIIPVLSQFQSVKTDNLHLVYYDRGHSYIVPHLVRSFDNAMRFHKELFDYSPSEEVTVLLEDFGDYGNAGATAIPYNFVMIGISPIQFAFETNPKGERVSGLMNHELVHIVALDMASRSDNVYRTLFQGKVFPDNEDPISILYSYLTNPRHYSPRWYHEGIAIFTETWMAGGIGRAQGAYDEMVFRTMVRDDRYIYDAIGLESEGTTIDFQVGANSYLYGTRFMSYLALKYEPEKLIRWVARSDESKRYYASQFREVFGESLDDVWTQWIAWEQQWQQNNLERIRRNPVTSDRPIANQAVGAVSRTYYDEARNEIYAAINYPGQVSYIAGINPDDGSLRRIVDVKDPAMYFVSSLAYDNDTGTLFYTTNNNQWRDLNAVNVDTRKSERLMRSSSPLDVRTGDLTFNPADRSLWGVRHSGGYSSIVRIPYPYEEWNRVHTMDFVEVIFDIDISPDGKYLSAALFDISGNHKLILMETEQLLDGEFSYRTIQDFEENTPANFTFSPDGQYLYGSTYFSGVSNIVRYDIENDELNWITNGETGYFRPVPVSEDSLLAFRYTGDGFLPVMLADQRQESISSISFLGHEVVMQQPIVRDWYLSPSGTSSVDTDELITYRGNYSPASNIRLTSAYPIVRGYQDYANVGMRFNLKDRVLFHQLDFSLSYTPTDRLDIDERFHATLNYKVRRWNFFANYNADDFYDLFGPTKTSRKGYSFGLNYEGSIIYDTPRLMNYNLNAAYYGGIEQLPDFQNIEVRIPDFFITTASLNYQYLLHSLGAVDHEKGYRWRGISYFNFADGTLYPRVLSNFDYGIQLPIRHSSLWLRTSVGYSFGDREEPLANFFFGGFGNNWVDYRAFRRYREHHTFPGVELNSIGGTNYGKMMVEWTIPPIRFRRFGFVSLYSNWAQLTLFSSGIVTNVDNTDYQRRVYNIGTQLDFRLVILSVLESTLSFGYAAAFEDGRSMTDEFMVSLRILI